MDESSVAFTEDTSTFNSEVTEGEGDDDSDDKLSLFMIACCLLIIGVVVSLMLIMLQDLADDTEIDDDEGDATAEGTYDKAGGPGRSSGGGGVTSTLTKPITTPVTSGRVQRPATRAQRIPQRTPRILPTPNKGLPPLLPTTPESAQGLPTPRATPSPQTPRLATPKVTQLRPSTPKATPATPTPRPTPPKLTRPPPLLQSTPKVTRAPPTPRPTPPKATQAPATPRPTPPKITRPPPLRPSTPKVTRAPQTPRPTPPKITRPPPPPPSTPKVTRAPPTPRPTPPKITRPPPPPPSTPKVTRAPPTPRPTTRKITRPPPLPPSTPKVTRAPPTPRPTTPKITRPPPPPPSTRQATKAPATPRPTPSKVTQPPKLPPSTPKVTQAPPTPRLTSPKVTQPPPLPPSRPTTPKPTTRTPSPTTPTTTKITKSTTPPARVPQKEPEPENIICTVASDGPMEMPEDGLCDFMFYESLGKPFDKPGESSMGKFTTFQSLAAKGNKTQFGISILTLDIGVFLRLLNEDSAKAWAQENLWNHNIHHWGVLNIHHPLFDLAEYFVNATLVLKSAHQISLLSPPKKVVSYTFLGLYSRDTSACDEAARIMKIVHLPTVLVILGHISFKEQEIAALIPKFQCYITPPTIFKIPPRIQNSYHYRLTYDEAVLFVACMWEKQIFRRPVFAISTTMKGRWYTPKIDNSQNPKIGRYAVFEECERFEGYGIPQQICNDSSTKYYDNIYVNNSYLFVHTFDNSPGRKKTFVFDDAATQGQKVCYARYNYTKYDHTLALYDVNYDYAPSNCKKKIAGSYARTRVYRKLAKFINDYINRDKKECLRIANPTQS
ncbi:uncharacterized protein [Dermacentor albipictus]|uniref:uncharacterized protein isoform X2 n=1 Tax=Dermacentor albipictus TaxID=60249 RepID=UPI0031FDA75C